jgi:hypothetical protein
VNQTGDTGDGDTRSNVLDAKGPETFRNCLGRLKFLETKLRILMKVPPVGDHAGHDLINIAAQSINRRYHALNLLERRRPGVLPSLVN